MKTYCLKNKNCLITGATGGVGKEVSIQLADQSCNLFLTGRNKKKLESLKKLLIKNNPDINFMLILLFNSMMGKLVCLTLNLV